MRPAYSKLLALAYSTGYLIRRFETVQRYMTSVPNRIKSLCDGFGVHSHSGRIVPYGFSRG
jgi:hypothetical protein